MTNKLRITLLGPLTVFHDGHSIPERAWHSHQERRLLGILLTAGGARVPTTRLLDWLWPDADKQSAAITLRSTVSNLRQVLEPHRQPRSPSRYILTRPNGYAWNADSDAALDVDEFLRHLQQAVEHAPQSPTRAIHLQHAIALYHADYLEDEPDASWAFAPRAALRERFLSAIQEYAEITLAEARYSEAINLVLRGLSHDHLREPLYRTLMQAQASAGDVAAALQSYERYRQLLDDELGAVPSIQTQQLHTAILRGELSWANTQTASPNPIKRHPPPSSLPFVGRSKELTMMQRWLDDLEDQHGGVVALVGEGGIGKTRLILEMVRTATSRGMRTILLRCSELERNVPFAPLSETLRPLVRTIPQPLLQELPPVALAQTADLLPVLHERLPDLPMLPIAPANEGHNRLLDGLVDLALALAHTSPLIICCDDAHWADEATLTVIGRLARRAHRHALLIVLAYRSEELPANSVLHSLLRTLGREMLLRPLVLGRLSTAEVTEFLAKLADVSSEQVIALARGMATISGGNPLFLNVAVQSLLETHNAPSLSALLPRLADTPLLPDLAEAPPIRDLVLASIERLPASAKDLIEQLAIIGRPVSLDLVEQLAGQSALEAAQTLLGRQLLIELPDGRLGFGHDLVRNIVASMLSSPRRRLLHRRAAEAIVELVGDRPENSAELAFHFGQIGKGAEPAVLHYALAAGDYARHTFGYREAVRFYDIAIQAAERLDHPAIDDLRRAFHGRLLACEAQLDWDGIMATATRHERWAERYGWTALVAPHRLAMLRALIGDLAGAADISAELARRQPELLPVLQDMLRRTAQILSPPDPDNVAIDVDQLPRFIPAAEVPGTPALDLPALLGIDEAVLPLAQVGWAVLTQGSLAEAEPCLMRSYMLACETGQHAIAVIASLQLAHLHALRGERSAAKQWIEHSLDLARQTPEAAWASIWPRIHQAFLLLLDEHHSEAQAEFQDLEQHLEHLPAFQSHRASVQAGLGVLALARGDLAQADRQLAAVQTAPHLLYGFVYIAVQHGRARLALQHGEIPAARRILTQALHYSSQRSLLPEYIHTVLEIARLERATTISPGRQSLLGYARDLATTAGLIPLATTAQTLLDRL